MAQGWQREILEVDGLPRVYLWNSPVSERGSVSIVFRRPPLRHMIGLLRFVRGLCGFLFGLNVMGLYTMNTWLLFTINIVSMVISGALFLWLRRYINRLHTERYGKPHPALGKMWGL